MSGPLAPIKRGARGRPAPPERAQQAELAARLASRRGEIEAAAITRIYAISDPAETEDPQYVEGLRAALVAAVDYGLAAIELGEERCPPPPPALLVQARMAARAGVGLDTVLRRYFAGYSLLGDFLIEEVETTGVRGPELQRLLRTQAVLFERLLAAVGEEHAREAEEGIQSAEERRAEQVERLLAGEMVDTSTFSYDFEGTHIGLVANGSGVPGAIRALADALDCRSLIVSANEQTTWAWLGTHRQMAPDQLLPRISQAWTPLATLAIGEPACGLSGWRFTHRQAKAALPTAQQSAQAIVRYADVALLASMCQDELLTASLRQLYLAPLDDERDRGAVLRHTLRAYFATERNVSSAASSLGVSRQAVRNRLRTVEERIGHSLDARAADLELALAAEQVGL